MNKRIKFMVFVILILIGEITFSNEKKEILERKAISIIKISEINTSFGHREYKLPRGRIKVEASSYLKDKKYSYPVKNTIDGNINTSWAEGVDGFGKGETIKLTIDLRNIKGTTNEIRILPGYGKSKALFKKNNRLKTFWLKSTSYTFDSRYTLQDKYAYHALLTKELYGGKIYTINLYIEDVYRGSKYDDTCISEIIVVMTKPEKIIDG